MARVRATVNDRQKVRVRAETNVTRQLEDFTDIDTKNKENGSVLVYKETTENWRATTDLNQQNIDGGEF